MPTIEAIGKNGRLSSLAVRHFAHLIFFLSRADGIASAPNHVQADNRFTPLALPKAPESEAADQCETAQRHNKLLFLFAGVCLECFGDAAFDLVAAMQHHAITQCDTFPRCDRVRTILFR